MEVKADSLEESFAAVQHDNGALQLRAELDDLKIKLRQNLVTAARPLLGGEQKSVREEQFAGAQWRIAANEQSSGEVRWLTAAVEVSMGPWLSPESPIVLCNGRLGQIRRGQQGLEGEVLIQPASSNDSPCPRTSPECRAQLGDRQCRIELRTRRLRTAIREMDGASLSLGATELERFRFGGARWLSGRNSGIDQIIVDVTDGSIILREPPSFLALPGDRIELTEGCDGRLQTCHERFQNVVNFRGEPHLPGTDFVTRYPGV